MRIHYLLLLALTSSRPAVDETALREGSSPQLAMDARGTVRMIFGRGDTIFAASSVNQGATFGPPGIVGIVHGMHLGNTRGPVVASGRNASLVSATDKDGNMYLFRLDHRTNAWTRRAWTLNSSAGSAPEGLGTLAADGDDTFYSTWLDFRDARKTSIYFARIETGAANQPVNHRLYASPDGHVCECCRPSVAAAGAHVAVMFRNWINGYRDLYLVQSSDGGKSFGAAEKLGTGTWKFDACPMDGGAVTIDETGRTASVWRRELTIYRAVPGSPEEAVAEGKSPMMSSRGAVTHVVWQDKAAIKIRTLGESAAHVVAEGRLPQVLSLTDGHALVAWERDGRVHYARR